MNQPISRRAARRLALALLLFLLALPLASRRQPLIVYYRTVSAYLTEAQQESGQKLRDQIGSLFVYNCPGP